MITIGESDYSLFGTSFDSVTRKPVKSPLDSKTTMSRYATCVQRLWEFCERRAKSTHSNR